MIVSLDVNPELSLGTLVAEQPGRAQLFEQLHLDYCCGGRQTLAQACAKRGLDLDKVCAALQELDAADRGDDVESTDWLATGVSELCEHIVGVHHDGLREVVPRIDGLLRTPLASRHRVTATPSEASDAPLPCCEAWIAEQTHRWVSGRARNAHSQAAWLR